MSEAAARRRALWPALLATVAALLAATVAQASLPRDACRSELLAKPALAAALANADRLEKARFHTLDPTDEAQGTLTGSIGGTHRPTFTVDLAEALQNSPGADKARVQSQPFGLLAWPPRPAEGDCGQALASALEGVGPEKLASGVLTWKPEVNIWRIRYFASILQWAPEKYAFVAWQPHMARDPLGLQEAQPPAPASPVPCPPEVSFARCLELQRFADEVEQERQADSQYSVVEDWERGMAAPFASTWQKWSSIPEKGRAAGESFWRYEPAVTPEQRELGLDYGARAAQQLGQTAGQITGGAAGLVLEVGQTVVETEIAGRLVRAVVTAGGKLVKVIEDLGPVKGPGRYVVKTERMSAEAKALEERVAYGRPGQAYRIPYDNPKPRGRQWVDVDGAAPNGIPIDSKVAIVTTPKTVDQATRQAAAFRQNHTSGVWKVTSLGEAARANRMIQQAGAGDVIRIVVEQ